MENGLEKSKLDRRNGVIQVEMLWCDCGDRENGQLKRYLGGKMDRICMIAKGSVKGNFLTCLAG